MADRPILFSAPMVRALLAGTKTQTRRVVKGWPLEWLAPGMFTPEYIADPANAACPYGVPGDRLWVRETFAHICTGNGIPDARRPGDVVYRADGHGIDAYAFGRWCPSIHMPRWASRVTLNVTDVRVERLQAISEDGARAEGVDYDPGEGGIFWVPGLGCTSDSAVDSFRQLWSSINGAESWDSNPWVWVVEFERATQTPASPEGAKENDHE